MTVPLGALLTTGISHHESTTPGHAEGDRTELVSESDHAPRPIVFFDGVCGLCNHLVDFVLARDHQGRILLAPLQGETARQRLPSAEREHVDTIVMLVDGHSYRRSSAVVRLLWKLGGIWSFLGSLLWLIPLPVRNIGYRVVAANRYRFFGQKQTCRMPTPEERERLLP